MATNSYNNAVKITKSAMQWLENNTIMPRYVNTQHKTEFEADGAKHGDTLHIRVPGSYSVRTGAAANPQGYNDVTVPVTVAQSGVDLKFTSKDMMLFLEDGEAFHRNVLGPMMAPLASYLDQGAFNLYTSIPQATGTPGTLPTDLSAYLDAGAILDDNAAPRDGQRSAILSPWSQSSLVNGLKNLFHPGQTLEEQLKTGTMGDQAGLMFSMDQNVKNHTVGTIGTSTPLMNGSTLDGATQVVTDGWASSAATLKVGDIISISGVYSVNPVTKATNRTLRQFVVTEDVTSSGVDMTIKISPAITLTGPTQNVNALPANNAPIYVYGKNDNTYSAKQTNTDIVMHRDAFALVTIDMPKPQSCYFCTRIKSRVLKNISFRLIQWYNGQEDSELYRIDMMSGWALARPSFACRVQG